MRIGGASHPGPAARLMAASPLAPDSVREQGASGTSDMGAGMSRGEDERGSFGSAEAEPPRMQIMALRSTATQSSEVTAAAGCAGECDDEGGAFAAYL